MVGFIWQSAVIVSSLLKGGEPGFDVLLLNGIAPLTLLEGLDWCLCLGLSFC